MFFSFSFSFCVFFLRVSFDTRYPQLVPRFLGLLAHEEGRMLSQSCTCSGSSCAHSVVVALLARVNACSSESGHGRESFQSLRQGVPWLRRQSPDKSYLNFERVSASSWCF